MASKSHQSIPIIKSLPKRVLIEIIAENLAGAALGAKIKMVAFLQKLLVIAHAPLTTCLHTSFLVTKVVLETCNLCWVLIEWR